MVVNFLAKLGLGIRSLPLDERKLFLIEPVLLINGITNHLFQLFELNWNTLSLFLILLGHKENLVATFFERILAPNFNIFLRKLRSKEVDIVDRFLSNFTVSLWDDSDEEVHKNDQKEDDVGEVEDDPNDSDHDFGEEPVMTMFNLCFPEHVLGSGDISNGISCGLHDVH